MRKCLLVLLVPSPGQDRRRGRSFPKRTSLLRCAKPQVPVVKGLASLLSNRLGPVQLLVLVA